MTDRTLQTLFKAVYVGPILAAAAELRKRENLDNGASVQEAVGLVDDFLRITDERAGFSLAFAEELERRREEYEQAAMGAISFRCRAVPISVNNRAIIGRTGHKTEFDSMEKYLSAVADCVQSTLWSRLCGVQYKLREEFPSSSLSWIDPGGVRFEEFAVRIREMQYNSLPLAPGLVADMLWKNVTALCSYCIAAGMWPGLERNQGGIAKMMKLLHHAIPIGAGPGYFENELLYLVW